MITIELFDVDAREVLDESTLDDFKAANAEDEEILEITESLAVGESRMIGGGAAPLVRITKREVP